MGTPPKLPNSSWFTAFLIWTDISPLPSSDGKFMTPPPKNDFDPAAQNIAVQLDLAIFCHLRIPQSKA